MFSFRKDLAVFAVEINFLITAFMGVPVQPVPRIDVPAVIDVFETRYDPVPC